MHRTIDILVCDYQFIQYHRIHKHIVFPELVVMLSHFIQNIVYVATLLLQYLCFLQIYKKLTSVRVTISIE